MNATELWRDGRMRLSLLGIGLVAAGYPSFVFHPLTLLAPVPLLIAVLLLDDAQLIAPVWAFAAGAMITWAIVLYVVKDGTSTGLIYSAAMYAPFAALALRARRPESIALVMAVVTTVLVSIRVGVSWARAGARWLPWQVYEGNELTSRLALLLPLIVLAWLGLPPDRWRQRGLLVLVFGVSLTCIVLTLQRAALAAVAILVVVGLARTFWKALLAVGVVVLVAWLVARQSMVAVLERARFVNFSPSSAARPEIWRVALEKTRDSSWLGVGPGNSPKALREIGMAHAHNGFFQSALEAGWLGALLFACLAVYLGVLAVRLLLQGGQDTMWALPLIAYGVFSVFSAPLQRPDLTLILVLVIMAARQRVHRRGEACLL